MDAVSSLVYWYRRMKKQEDSGDIDDSYIYDIIHDKFNELSRGNLLDLVKFLSSHM